jgi:hypothetical protein
MKIYDATREATFDSLDAWKTECINYAIIAAGWPKKETENFEFTEEDGYVVMRDRRTGVEYERGKIKTK